MSRNYCKKNFSSHNFWSWARRGAAGLAPPPPYLAQQRCDYYRSATLCPPTPHGLGGHLHPPPYGRGCKNQCGGTRHCLLYPTSVGTLQGVTTQNQPVPLVCPPVGHTIVGHKTIHKSKKFRPKISCSLQLWGGRIYQPENFLNITAVVSELLF